LFYWAAPAGVHPTNIPGTGPTRSAAMTTIENRALAADAAEKLLTVDDLCEYLVVSKDFIYDEVRQGRLPASRIARQLRFRPADVDAFVEANAVTSSDI
jgi:excisionase family DNA binding protein